MLTPDTIQQAIDRANELAYYYVDKIIIDNTYGDSDACCQLKPYVLTKWANILADYKFQHYDENDNIITPSFECTTSDQVQKLIGKINSVRC